MKRLNSLFRLIGNRPTIAIQFVLGVISIVYGIFVLTLYVPSISSPGLIQFFLTDYVRYISGVGAILPGIFALAGCFGFSLWKKKPPFISNTGNYGLFLANMYYVIVRFLTHTAWVWTWLFPLGLAMIAGILLLSKNWQDIDE